MKKLICLFVVLFFLTFTFSCDNSLNIPPDNIITEEDVFQDESLLTAYFASLYDAIPMDDFNSQLVGPEAGGYGIGNGFWGYQHIRRVNDMIEKLPDAIVGDDLKTILMGEAQFIRAYYYFEMVRRYGGVPIISEVQHFSPDEDDVSEFQVSRDHEEDVYDFIADELSEAVLLLPDTNTEGRANRFAALALKSRAMIYAASSAQYAPVQLDGIIGISDSESVRYWEAARDAANEIITSGSYSLYDQNPDKAANFHELFFTNTSESIFVKYYQFPEKTHNFDRSVIPYGVRGPDGFSSARTPTLRLVEIFERVDGSPGVLTSEIIGTNNDPIFYDHPTDLFADYDPRLQGTVIVPFSDWRGQEIDVQAGIYDEGVKIEAGDPNARFNPDTKQIDENGTVPVVGLSGFGGSERTTTGFYLRKYLDPSLDRSQVRTGGSSQDWIAIRYAEVLLNYAESVAELGNLSEAREKVNMIRERAGVELLEEGNISIEKVRQERLAELAYESHHWYDYRRWRIATDIFNNIPVESLRPYYDLQEEAWRFEIAEVPQGFQNFNPNNYYMAIPEDQRATNPNLVQNPGY